jgi:hypothetical protein
MTIFIEVITDRHDGRSVWQRTKAPNMKSAHMLASMFAVSFELVRGDANHPERFTASHCPFYENDMGEPLCIIIQEYSPDARVKEGVDIMDGD